MVETTRSSQLVFAPLTALKNKFFSELRSKAMEGNHLLLRMNEPFNLYLANEQAELYLETIAAAPFERQLYRPLARLYQDHAAEIIDLPPDTQLDFIDLGPGLPDKSLPLVDYLDANHPGFRYIPVDISHCFLEITKTFFRYRRFPIIPFNVLFEDIHAILAYDPRFRDSRLRVVNIGLTFSNFQPDQIIKILSDIMGVDGVCIIATEIIDHIGQDAALAPYRTPEADEFNFRMLKLIGLNRDVFKYSAKFNGNRVEMGFTLLNDITLDSNTHVRTGTFILTSVSYRYRLSDLREILNRSFSRVSFHTTTGSSVCVVRLERGA